MVRECAMREAARDRFGAAATRYAHPPPLVRPWGPYADSLSEEIRKLLEDAVNVAAEYGMDVHYRLVGIYVSLWFLPSPSTPSNVRVYEWPSRMMW